MGKIIDYTGRMFSSGDRRLYYRFANDYPTKAAAEKAANDVRKRGNLARITKESNISKARINKTGLYLLWVRD
jgi:hypothetical protein